MGRTYFPYSRYRRPFAPFSGGGPELPVRDGRFEIPGCDPDKPYTFHFLDVQRQLGATVEISGKSATTGPDAGNRGQVVPLVVEWFQPIIQKDTVAGSPWRFLQRQRDEVAESAVRQCVLIRK